MKKGNIVISCTFILMAVAVIFPPRTNMAYDFMGFSFLFSNPNANLLNKSETTLGDFSEIAWTWLGLELAFIFFIGIAVYFLIRTNKTNL